VWRRSGSCRSRQQRAARWLALALAVFIAALLAAAALAVDRHGAAAFLFPGG
jgi:hypothetical protein